jgi:hypothetical protein
MKMSPRDIHIIIKEEESRQQKYKHQQQQEENLQKPMNYFLKERHHYK